MGCSATAGPNADPTTATRDTNHRDQSTAAPLSDSVTTVLQAGSTVLAHTAAGRIKIAAGPGGLRIFSWDSAHRRVITKPRKEPFPGADSIGLHYSGTPAHWSPYKGIDKLVYEESTRTFGSPAAVRVWTQIRRLYFSYNDRGLAVGWKRDGDTLHVEVWRFYIDGHTPKTLPGADNSKVILKAASRAIPEKAHPSTRD